VITLFWTPQARDDLAAIHAYVSQSSVPFADLTVRELIKSVRRLADFPESGRVAPEPRRADVREVIWRSYRLVYRHLPDRREVHVLTVFRSERPFPSLMGLPPEMGAG